MGGDTVSTLNVKKSSGINYQTIPYLFKLKLLNPLLISRVRQ